MAQQRVEGERTDVGLSVVDVSTPGDPVVVGHAAFRASRGRRLIVQGGRAYVEDSIDGIQVIDVRTPEAPRLVERIPRSANQQWEDFTILGETIVVAGWTSADRPVEDRRHTATLWGRTVVASGTPLLVHRFRPSADAPEPRVSEVGGRLFVGGIGGEVWPFDLRVSGALVALEPIAGGAPLPRGLAGGRLLARSPSGLVVLDATACTAPSR